MTSSSFADIKDRLHALANLVEDLGETFHDIADIEDDYECMMRATACFAGLSELMAMNAKAFNDAAGSIRARRSRSN